MRANQKAFFIISFIITITTQISCSKKEDKVAAHIEKSSQKAKIYLVTGNINIIDFNKKRVKIDHDDIGDYMGAMTMWFSVEKQELLEKLKNFKRGEEVKFELKTFKDTPSVIVSMDKIPAKKIKKPVIFNLRINTKDSLRPIS